MDFLTWDFFFFVVMMVSLYWFLPLGWRKPLLILGGVAFFVYGSPDTIWVVIIMGAVTFLGGFLSARTKERALWPIVLAIILNLGFLAYFKYLGNISSLLNTEDHLSNVVIPIGISFFTFEFIHYLVEIKKGNLESAKALDFFNYAFFFPTRISGPIKRFGDFQKKIPAEIEVSDVYYGLFRIVSGLSKKVLIADPLTNFSNMLNSPSEYSQTGLWVAMYAYTLKIYFDFSGYSDMAIGVSRLFGYQIHENFDWPYIRTNISQFWRSWHITLSNWVRDYLFIPLGGSRKSTVRTLLNSLIVMTVVGLWHGGTLNFIFWGAYHGLGLGIYHLWKRYVSSYWNDMRTSLWYKSVSWLITFHFVAFGWIFFASTRLSDALYTIKYMLN